VKKIFVALLMVFLFLTSAEAADKIRIAYSAGTGSILFSLRIRKGFLKRRELTLRLSE